MGRILLFCLLLPAWCGAATAARDSFIAIPAASYEVVDSRSGIAVTVSVDEFLIAGAETTQEEFSGVMGCNPSFHQGPDYPVENVTWWQAVTYCNLRSIREGLEPCYDLSTGECDLSRSGYRLPTEAEWELADSSDCAYTAETVRRYGNIGSDNTKSVPELEKDLLESGTRKAGTCGPNHFGIYDMLGNVWEWCGDYRDPEKDVPLPLHDPQGPPRGVERVVRGGSFISLAGNWARGYRSSVMPDYRSRFLGFRVCRSSGRKETSRAADSGWSEPYNRVPEGFAGNTGGLASLVAGPQGKGTVSPEGWSAKRKLLQQKWEKLLGTPDLTPPAPAARTVSTFREDDYTGWLMYLQVEPDFWEKIFLMVPDKPLARPAPVVIVPYYDVDTPAGKNLGGRSLMPLGVRAFAYLMVQQGYVAVAIRWYGESYGESYAEAVANLKLRHPGLTGLGKWVWDARRLVDYLCTLPEVDSGRIGIIGHSLGAKLSLYAAAMDERIAAVAASEPGIGLEFSNYEDYWYLGDKIRQAGKSTDHHELLGLIAPRPFLLIGGDSADDDRSWYYINSAREVYSLFGKPLNIGYFNHRTGHTPTPEAVRLAVDWLRHFLDRR